MTATTHLNTAELVTAIPLNQLVLWEGNVRKTGVSDGLDQLKASIAAHGVLQSLLVQRTANGGFAVVAGQRRFLALSALAAEGAVEAGVPVPCRIVAESADAAEVSLTENVIRAAMHPADQFEAFRDLIDHGASIADVAARFGIAESAVKQRLKLARVSPTVFAAYRDGELTLEEVQAFAVSDDHAAQERVLDEIARRNGDADDIRGALTENDIPATDRRARFVTVEAYERAGGALLRDLFADGESGVYLLDAALLDRLVLEKLQGMAEALKAEGWKWAEALPEFDYETGSVFRRRHPEQLPLSEAAQAELQQLSDEYDALLETAEPSEETDARLEAIESRIDALQDTGHCYSSEVFAIAGAVVSIGYRGEVEIHRGLVRPDDESETDRSAAPAKERPEFSASLVESLTQAKSAGIGAALAKQPAVALAVLTHRIVCGVFRGYYADCALQLSAKTTYYREASPGATELDALHEQWVERLPSDTEGLWKWCLAQEQNVLLDLLAYCVARTVNAVQTNQDRDSSPRLANANALAEALSFDMAEWFTPTAANFFGRVSRTAILSSIAEAKGVPAKRSWEKLKKAELAALAARETAGSGWLPKPLRA